TSSRAIGGVVGTCRLIGSKPARGWVSERDLTAPHPPMLPGRMQASRVPPGEEQMRTTRTRQWSTAFAALGLAVAAGVAGLGPGGASATSHRDATLTAADPAVDNTDVYAFASPDRPGYATLMANYI